MDNPLSGPLRHCAGLTWPAYKVAKHPLDSIPAPDESVLKEVPGAYEAWKGLSSLEFRVCTVRGPKIIIHPEKLAAFQHAPLSISEEVGRLEQ